MARSQSWFIYLPGTCISLAHQKDSALTFLQLLHFSNPVFFFFGFCSHDHPSCESLSSSLIFFLSIYLSLCGSGPIWWHLRLLIGLLDPHSFHLFHHLSLSEMLSLWFVSSVWRLFLRFLPLFALIKRTFLFPKLSYIYEIWWGFFYFLFGLHGVLFLRSVRFQRCLVRLAVALFLVGAVLVHTPAAHWV